MQGNGMILPNKDDNARQTQCAHHKTLKGRLLHIAIRRKAKRCEIGNAHEDQIAERDDEDRGICSM